MHARYLPVCRCWRVFEGCKIVEIRGVRRWPCTDWLEHDLKAVGLKLDTDTGEITELGEPD